MTLQPCFSNLLLQVKDGTKPDSILLPDSADHLQPYGEILAIGPDVKHFVVGDKVFFRPQLAIGVDPSQHTCLINEGMVEGKYVDDLLA